MLPMGKKQSIHTERNVVDGQITHEVLFSRKLIPPFASIKQPITAIMYLIAICHSKDQRPLKAEHLPNIQELMPVGEKCHGQVDMILPLVGVF